MEVSAEESILWLITVLLVVVKSAAQKLAVLQWPHYAAAARDLREPVDAAPSYRLLFGSGALTLRHSLTSSSLIHSESCIFAK